MHIRFGAVTDIGRKRAKNQDSIAAVPEVGLFLVADGMGGHQGGEIASAMAADLITKTVRKSPPTASPRTSIAEAIRAANDAIFQRARQNEELSNMGTTATALLFPPAAAGQSSAPASVTIGHVGDSRCYLIHRGAIWQLTRDHSLVQEKLRAGLITRAQLKTDRMKNVITRSVGFEPRLEVDIYEMALHPGDIFLICSDGLSGMVDDEQILALVQKNLVEEGNIDQTVSRLIETANAHGGDDNVSAVVVQITE